MSLLDALTPGEVEEHPFPHIVHPHAMDDALVRLLVRECPPLHVLTRGARGRSNEKFIWPAHRALRSRDLSPAWRRLFEELIAPDVWREWLRLFRAPLLRHYPDFEARFGRIDSFRVGVRDVDDASDCDVLLDSKIVAHVPVAGDPVAERGPHVKLLRTLFLGYIDLRPDEDDAAGAEHVLYSIRPGAKPMFDCRQATDPAALQAERIVPYRRNTLLAFMNTPQSIQTRAPRGASRLPMLAFHFTAHVREPLFDLRMVPGARPIRMEDARWYKRSPGSLLAGAWRRAAALTTRG